MNNQKEAVPSQKSFFVSYEAQNFYKIFIEEISKIENLRDIKFMEDYQSLAIYLADEGLFYYLNFILKKKQAVIHES